MVMSDHLSCRLDKRFLITHTGEDVEVGDKPEVVEELSLMSEG